MEQSFWHERWARQEIGFHQAEINGSLQRYWSLLDLQPGAQVLVPLCGKSLDLCWLLGQGFRVLGVELSPVAVAAFFEEQGLQPTRSRVGRFESWRCGELEILCGDVFDLQIEQLAQVAGFYDRAALVALPPALRERYAALLCRVLPPACDGLLVSFDYDQACMEGPPFAVKEVEVQRLFSRSFALQSLARLSVLEQSPRFKARGLQALEEQIFLLKRRR